MAFQLTKNARLASQKLNLEPIIVLDIEGVTTRYGARVISKEATIGEDLIIGDDWTIGGLMDLEDQEDLISFDAGTTSSIRQQLDPSKGIGSSISSMQVALIDKGGLATRLVSPGVVVDDVLGRRAKVYLGFEGTAFPSDYTPIFRGIIDDVHAKQGVVVLNLAHPDQKKRQQLFPKISGAELYTATIDDNDTLFALTGVDDMYWMSGKSGPDEDGLGTFIKLGNEWIELIDNLSVPPQWSRGRLGTSGAAHAAGDAAEVMYRLKGNVIDLALQLMLSVPRGEGASGGAYLYQQEVTSFVFVNSNESYDNTLFFADVDLVEKYGIRAGDYVFTEDTDNPGENGFTSNQSIITKIETRFDGTLVYVTGRNGYTMGLVEEVGSSAVASFVSPYNVLGVGLAMKPDEVDIDEHERIKRIALSSFEVEIYIKEETNIKELIEQELYSVAGAYSLPRKSKASVGLHIGPVPGAQAAIITAKDITNAPQLSVRRSINANFANTVIYKFDKSFDDDEFDTGLVVTDATSKTRIPVGTKAMVVESAGLRSTLNGENLATAAANRRLNRYKYAAEYIENLGVTYQKGFNIEIGDIFLLDATGLNLINSEDGDRSPPAKLYEVINKMIDIRTGKVTFSIVDTSFSTQYRYGLISPSSRIKVGLSQTKFIIEQWQTNSVFGSNEYLKWTKFMENGGTAGIKVRSENGTTRFAQTTISSISGNEITVTDALGFTPQAGDWFEFADYDFAGTTEIQKKLYAYMKNSAFADGGLQYRML